MKTLGAIVVLLALVGGGLNWYQRLTGSGPAVQFRSAKIERGEIIKSVEATGTLEPEELINVGAQVVGRIKEFGPDPRGESDPAFAGKRVDYGSTVQPGAVLARIDDAVYVAQRNQAKAAVDRARADLLQLKARYAQTEAEWKRAQRLLNLSPQPIGSGKLPVSKSLAVPLRGISDADFVLAKSNYEVAKANIALGEAAIQQAQSTLDLAETNLGYTVIQSPVKGTIIDRRVNIGQTVVSSLNAPSLFLLATDLARMEVWASVNEADIGELKVGTPVSFTVDAFPNDLFKGQVKQVRLNATMTSNVVTYTVVVSTDNSNLKLLPYLTANVTFEVQRRSDVLTVPNSALRYEPSAAVLATAQRPKAESEAENTTGPTLWIRRGEKITRMRVQTGLADGARTEVISPELEEGMEVIINELQPGEIEQVNNPFAPPRFPRSQPKT